MAIWRISALGEKAACEEMHLSGNQHTPCQTLFGLSLDCGDQPRLQTSRGGGDATATTLQQQKVLLGSACEPAPACGHLSTSNLTDNNKLYSI